MGSVAPQPQGIPLPHEATPLGLSSVSIGVDVGQKHDPSAIAVAETFRRVSGGARQDPDCRAGCAPARTPFPRARLLHQGEETCAVWRIAYKSHPLDMGAVIGDQRPLLAAQIAYVRARREFAKAAAGVERALGG